MAASKTTVAIDLHSEKNPTTDGHGEDSLSNPEPLDLEEDLIAQQGIAVDLLVKAMGSLEEQRGLSGIMISGMDETDGVWQYSRNGGESWQSWRNLSHDQPLTLFSLSEHRLRFIPGESWSGNTDIHFRTILQPENGLIDLDGGATVPPEAMLIDLGNREETVLEKLLGRPGSSQGLMVFEITKPSAPSTMDGHASSGGLDVPLFHLDDQETSVPAPKYLESPDLARPPAAKVGQDDQSMDQDPRLATGVIPEYPSNTVATFLPESPPPMNRSGAPPAETEPQDGPGGDTLLPPGKKGQQRPTFKSGPQASVSQAIPSQASPGTPGEEPKDTVPAKSDPAEDSEVIDLANPIGLDRKPGPDPSATITPKNGQANAAGVPEKAASGNPVIELLDSAEVVDLGDDRLKATAGDDPAVATATEDLIDLGDELAVIELTSQSTSSDSNASGSSSSSSDSTSSAKNQEPSDRQTNGNGQNDQTNPVTPGRADLYP